jgi:hypothetical protein
MLLLLELLLLMQPLLLLLIHSRRRGVVVLAGGLESLVRQFLARVLLFCAHQPKPSQCPVVNLNYQFHIVKQPTILLGWWSLLKFKI